MFSLADQRLGLAHSDSATRLSLQLVCGPRRPFFAHAFSSLARVREGSGANG